MFNSAYSLCRGAMIIAFAGSTFDFAMAQDHSKHAPYAGQQTRTIKSLSQNDIEALRNGSGWGLAKAAELNGLPGPLHVLELADDIGVTPDQRKKIERVFAAMRENTITLGAKLIAAEQKLDVFFQTAAWKKEGAAETLASLIQNAARARGDLRFVHLNAHLKMPPILSTDQIAKYNQLRGYGKADPCASVPKGHDPVMWRRHNGCK